MKSRKSLLFCLFCSLCFAVSYAHEDPKAVNEVLKEKIVKLIDEPDISHLAGHKYHAEVEFIITHRNQVLVLGVYTNELFFDDYIKKQLNYSHLKLKGVKRMMPYRLNVTFVQP